MGPCLNPNSSTPSGSVDVKLHLSSFSVPFQPVFLISSGSCGLHMGPRPPGYAYTTKFIMLVHTYLYCKQRSKGRREHTRAHAHTRGFIHAPEMLMTPSAGQPEDLPRVSAGKGQKDVDSWKTFIVHSAQRFDRNIQSSSQMVR